MALGQMLQIKKNGIVFLPHYNEPVLYKRTKNDV